MPISTFATECIVNISIIFLEIAGNRYGTRKEFVVESPTLVLIRREVIEAY